MDKTSVMHNMYVICYSIFIAEVFKPIKSVFKPIKFRIVYAYDGAKER